MTYNDKLKFMRFCVCLKKKKNPQGPTFFNEYWPHFSFFNELCNISSEIIWGYQSTSDDIKGDRDFDVNNQNKFRLH